MRRFDYIIGVTVSLLATAGSAQADVVLGQAGADVGCAYNMVLAQNPGIGPSYVVPSVGRVTSWSIAGGASGATEALVVLRPAGGSNYSVVGSAPSQTVAANVTATFPANISVQAGDLIGEWAAGTNDCVLSFGGATLDFSGAATALPNAGDPLTLPGFYNGGVLNMRATFSAGIDPIPTLQEWGLAALALMLLGLGMYLQRGRRES